MINDLKISQFTEFVRDERDSPIDHREGINQMSKDELDFLTEWSADLLSEALAEKRRRDGQ